MASKDPSSRRSKRFSCLEDDDELSLKIPKYEELEEEDKRSSTCSLSPAVGLRRESRAIQEKPAELFRKDLISAMKLADTDQLQADDYVFISDPWRQDWEKGVQVPVNPDQTIHRQIVTSKIEGNKQLYGTYVFKFPKKHLHATQDETYKQGLHELHETQKLAEQVCRYDLDDVDVTWLAKYNEERFLMGQEPVLEWVMEKVVEEMECQCYNNIQNMIKTVEGLGIEYDENVVCDVCRSPEGEDNNEIVFCDGCDICVHQACYGIQKIPEGSWLCRTCVVGIQPKCILCPKTGGAMKSTKSGTKWAHVSCALWIPEVSIGCPEKMEPITKISQIPSSRWSLICNICRERDGSCIQCSVKTCKTAFHVTCAFNNNLSMKTILDEDHDDVQLKAYCSKHSKRKEGETTPKKDELASKKEHNILKDLGTPKKESEMTEEEKTELRSYRLAKLAEEFYNCVHVPEVAEACKMDEETIDFLFRYWVLKRKANFNKPLLMPKTEEADLLLKQREDSLIARMKMFIHLRQDLERVRNLCYMVGRREKVRKQLYAMKEEIFIQQVKCLKKLGNGRSETREFKLIAGAHRQPCTVYDQYDGIIRSARIMEQKEQKEQKELRDEQDEGLVDKRKPIEKSVLVKRLAGQRDGKRRLIFKSALKSKKRGILFQTKVSEDSGSDSDNTRHSLPSSDELATFLDKRNEVDFEEPNKRMRSPPHSVGKRKHFSEENDSTSKDVSVTEPCEHKMDKVNDLMCTAASAKEEKLKSPRYKNVDTKVPSDVSVAEPCEHKMDKVNDLMCTAASAKEEKVKSPRYKNVDTKVPSEDIAKSKLTASAGALKDEKMRNVCQASNIALCDGDDLSSDTSEDVDVDSISNANFNDKDKSDVEAKPASDRSPMRDVPVRRSLRGRDTVLSASDQDGPTISGTNKSNASLTSDSDDLSHVEEKDKKANGKHPVVKSANPPNSSVSDLEGKDSSLPAVEVSVDENSGKISLRLRNYSDAKTQTCKSPSRDNSPKPPVSTEKSVPLENGDLKWSPSRHRSKSPSVLSVTLRDKQPSIKKERRISSRLQSLGINGLISLDQLVVKQDIKDKVHSRLGCLRNRFSHKHEENGVIDDHQNRGKGSISNVNMDSKIITGHMLAKENQPSNGSILKYSPLFNDLNSSEKSKAKFCPISVPSVELRGSESPTSCKRLSSVEPSSERSTPETRSVRRKVRSDIDVDGIDRRPINSLESSREGTPDIDSHRLHDNLVSFVPGALKGHLSSRLKKEDCMSSSVAESSDSELSIIKADYDSDYAISETSDSSSQVRRSNRRHNSISNQDECSRDSTGSVRSSSRLNRHWTKALGTTDR